MFRFNPPNAATYFAFSLASLFLAGLFVRFIVIGLVFAVGSLYFAAQALLALRRDPYDLRRLKELHDVEELFKSKLPDPSRPAHESVFCPYCAHIYSADLPTCPQCGRSVNA